MSTSGYLEDDDLILYAMQALTAAEATDVATSLVQSAELRQRYADIKLTLGLYATATVEPLDPPAGSLDRLMRSIAIKENVLRMPAAAPKAQPSRKQAVDLMPWAGWAVAALLLLTAGWEFVENRHLRQVAESGSSQLQAANRTTDKLSRERDALAGRAQQEASRANLTAAELSSRSAELSQQVDDATTRAEEERKRAVQLSAKVTAEASRAMKATAQAADLATVAAANAGERDRLQGTLRQQQNQMAQLGAQAVEARQVLDALTDPTALRATLLVPKQKKTPSGRGTYVPNRGTLLFAGSNLPQLHGDKVYELWLMPTDGSAPIPAGTFTPDSSGNATLVSTNFRKSIAAKGFAITAEPAGGSQKPTLPILLAAL